MRSRTPVLLAITFALGAALTVSGCSTPLPPPTVDNTKAQPQKSVEPTLGLDAVITVDELSQRLQSQGLKTTKARVKGSGLFLPATYQPLNVDGTFVQVYRFKSVGEARGAAATVDQGGFILGATPDQLVNVNWSGWPAFFRRGDLIVIFVTEKGSKNAARDKSVYGALKGILGNPFTGGNTPLPSTHTSGSPAATGSVPASGAGG